MPSIAGTTQQGFVRVLNKEVLTNPRVTTVFQNLKTVPPFRKGYWYLLNSDQGANPNSSVIERGVAYAPGFLAEVPSTYPLSGSLFTLFVSWNSTGDSYTVFYA